MINNEQSQQLIKLNFLALKKYLQITFEECYIPPLEQFLKINLDNKGDVISQGLKISKTENQTIKKLQQTQQILYLQSGYLSLHKTHFQNNERIHSLDIKEGSFFTLINYKNIITEKDQQPETYQLIPKKLCTISIIQINPIYNYRWLRAQSQKINLLSHIFGDEQEIKPQKLIQLAKYCNLQSFRRDTQLLNQFKSNQRVLIVFKGECSFSKALTYSHNSVKTKKITKLCSSGHGSIIGAETLLSSSSKVRLIIKNINWQSQKYAVDQKIVQQNTINPEQKSLNNISYIFENPSQNKSNFTVVGQSAYLQAYSIKLSDFLMHMTDKMRQILTQKYEAFYITLLRQTENKFSDFSKKIHILEQKKYLQKELISAQMASKLHHKEYLNKNEEENNLLEVKPQELIAIRDKECRKLRNNKVAHNRDIKLEQKVQMNLQKRTTNKNYKVSIQTLVKQKKLENNFSNSTKNLSEQDKKLKNQFVSDLKAIFMQQSENRTQSILRQSQILHRKSILLNARNFSSDKLEFQHNFKSNNASYRKHNIKLMGKQSHQNYLKGINIGKYTQQIKRDYAYKINKTNRIKQQFLKIKSECYKCYCYDNIDTISNSQHTFYDTKNDKNICKTAANTMKIGVSWRSNGKDITSKDEQPLEKVHSRTKFISDKSKQKFSHTRHLMQKKRKIDRISSRQVRKQSAPFLKY